MDALHADAHTLRLPKLPGVGADHGAAADRGTDKLPRATDWIAVGTRTAVIEGLLA